MFTYCDGFRNTAWNSWIWTGPYRNKPVILRNLRTTTRSNVTWLSVARSSPNAFMSSIVNDCYSVLWTRYRWFLLLRACRTIIEPMILWFRHVADAFTGIPKYLQDSSICYIHCKKYPYILGYFAVSFPYFNGTGSVYLCVHKTTE